MSSQVALDNKRHIGPRQSRIAIVRLHGALSLSPLPKLRTYSAKYTSKSAKKSYTHCYRLRISYTMPLGLRTNPLLRALPR